MDCIIIFLNVRFGGNMISNKNFKERRREKENVGTIDAVMSGKRKAQSCQHDLPNSEEMNSW